MSVCRCIFVQLTTYPNVWFLFIEKYYKHGVFIEEKTGTFHFEIEKK